MASVDLESVSKNFGAVNVLRDISLSFESGKYVALVGPSRCGKSTALRMIAGLEDIAAGTIKITDRRVNYVPSKDRDISMVFRAVYRFPAVIEDGGAGVRLDGGNAKALPGVQRRRQTNRLLWVFAPMYFRWSVMVCGHR
ncbi:ATP-binding cassette domain-containing protein [Rhizobium leguminosarum]|uniref:ATP-binding cassette domain-containing protein n=1 Tax=Rhizobium leguminosarum TaxID=384 RepID=UPI003F987C0C